MLKSLRFIPFCVLILSGHAFADDYGSSPSDSETEKKALAAEAAAAKAAAVAASAKPSKAEYVGNNPHYLYILTIRSIIQNILDDSLDIYKGNACTIRISLDRDGTVLYAIENGGDPVFCNYAIEIIRNIKKFPPPPSEQVYKSFKIFTIDLKS